ncbi:TPA: GntP family permease, partial [Streptococcus suis]
GVSTLTMSSLPGTPSIHNAVPTKVLGTTLTAAPLLSLVSSLILVVFGLTYMRFALKKSMARNEGYTERDEEIVTTDNANGW